MLLFILYLVGSTIYSPLLTGGPYYISDDLSLTSLASLSFENSNLTQDLLDTQFWDIVLRESGRTTTGVIPETVLGFVESSSEWQTLVRNNMPDPPTWIYHGLSGYSVTLLNELNARIVSQTSNQQNLRATNESQRDS